MLEKFQNHINHQLPFLLEGKLLIAISGGVDSVVLSHLCKASKLDISFAHCNFNLRGNESDKDEEFILQLADSLNIEAFVQSFETEKFAKQNKLSIQMAARDLRYQWFEELKEQLEFDYVLTAHHADDNLETFLINLSRGTGLDGLTGIPMVNNVIVRPLLPFTRQEILEFANQNDLAWREDASNASVKYLRNKIRHEVLPILKGINPQLLQNFNVTISHLQEAQNLVDDRVDEVSDAIIEVCNDAISLDVIKLNTLNNPKAYLYQLLKAYGFTQWDDVYGLLDAQSGKQVLSNNWRLIKDRTKLLLSEIEVNKEEQILISDFTQSYALVSGKISFEEVANIQDTNTNFIYVDRDTLKKPIIVRKKQEGDVFFPFGMKGSKKLSKFFKDEKLSLLDKEKVELLCSGNDIVWIVGKRADNRFKVTDKTNTILKITIK